MSSGQVKLNLQTFERRARNTSFLRWAGSKRQILPVLSEYWKDSYSRYLEPFAGSACLFFHLGPKKAILGDLNRNLIDTFIALRDHPHQVIRYLRDFSLGKQNYYKIRQDFHSETHKFVKAAQFIFLNRFCFNGLYRTNSDGKFNVPYGGVKSGSLPAPDHLLVCSEALQTAELLACDFGKVLAKAKAGDFVYMDPPFAVQNRRVFREYGPGLFSHKHVERLRNCLLRLNRKGVPFLVSYAESEEADTLGEGFLVRKVAVKRNIAGFAGKRKRAYELLISN